MAEFLCRVGAADGAITERLVTAESAAEARDILAGDSIAVFDVRRHRRGRLGRPNSRQGGVLHGLGKLRFELRRERLQFRARRRIGTGDLLLVNQELAALVRAGLPLLRCLDILRGRRAGTRSGELLDRVRERVAAGASLSRAFEAEDAGVGIPGLYVTSLAVGEAGGDFEGALRRYSAHLERAIALKRRVRGALLYPAALFSVSMAVIAVLVGFVLPRFADFYASYGAQLPTPTRVLLGVAGFFQGRAQFLVVLAALLVVTIVVLARRGAVRALRDRWTLRVPVLGRLRRLYFDLEAARTLATLLAGGAPLTQALDVTARGSENAEHRRRLLWVGELVRQGTSLNRSFEEAGLLDPMGHEMVEVGEYTGTLESMLEHVSAAYEEILERRLNALVGLLEPAVLVSMGIFVAVVLLSLYLPLFNTVQVIG